MEKTQHPDTFVRRVTSDMMTGQPLIDVARANPGRRYHRIEALGDHRREKRVRIPFAEFPAIGVAVGRCRDGLVRPLHPQYAPQTFTGFVMAWASPEEAHVRAEGRYVLRVHDLDARREDSPIPVFAVDGNYFTADRSTGVPVGFVIRPESIDKQSYLVAFSDDLDRLHPSLTERGVRETATHRGWK
jgi:hypothetical protein